MIVSSSEIFSIFKSCFLEEQEVFRFWISLMISVFIQVVLAGRIFNILWFSNAFFNVRFICSSGTVKFPSSIERSFPPKETR